MLASKKTMLASLAARIAAHGNTLFQVLHFSATSKHPRRREIALSYLLIRLRLGISTKLGKPASSFSLFGTEMHFTDPNSLKYIFQEIFIEECYAGCPITPSTILDCGSNIGMSILYFKSCWPDAKVTGVEAFPATFALLKENVGGLNGVELINTAVSDKNGTITFYAAESSGVSSTNSLRGKGTKNITEATIQATPFSHLIDGSLDLLKIDIEGSEITAFRELEDSGKMPLIRFMFIEYHHHLPEEDSTFSSFLNRLERCGFDYEIAAIMPKRTANFQDIVIRAWRKENSESGSISQNTYN